MPIDRDHFGTSQPYVVDTAETIAVFKLSVSSIDREESVHVTAKSSESFEFRIDVGVVPDDLTVDGPDSASDLEWFEAGTGSVTASSDARVSLGVTELYLRLVVTTTASSGTTAEIAATKGR